MQSKAVQSYKVQICQNWAMLSCECQATQAAQPFFSTLRYASGVKHAFCVPIFVGQEMGCPSFSLGPKDCVTFGLDPFGFVRHLTELWPGEWRTLYGLHTARTGMMDLGIYLSQESGPKNKFSHQGQVDLLFSSGFGSVRSGITCHGRNWQHWFAWRCLFHVLAKERGAKKKGPIGCSCFCVGVQQDSKPLQKSTTSSHQLAHELLTVPGGWVCQLIVTRKMFAL